ncbi:hypothetical protein [Candidatus Williamhamiltonella defendens]|uniref:hypothetical protein n=1 Tax=Candidatus Williamhamiltonella defendens TaxID=138072 RepID=UPI0015822A98|nr:hypothetical protein [Candidatus Hamiltonella defensa]
MIKLVKNFKLSIKPLVENSLEFGEFFAIRAHEALTHADRISDKIKSSTNKVFSYQLDNKSVGLISANIFPQVIIIERLVGHPGVQNAGYLLIEHVLNCSKLQNPIVKLIAANEVAESAYARIGFKFMTNEVGMCLDLNTLDTQKLWKKIDNRWVCTMAGNIPKYLASKPSRLI